MICLGSLARKGGEIRVIRLEDGGALDEGSPVRGILLSRVDVDVQVLDIPRLPAQEVEGLIRYRLRTCYPGSPEDTSFDYRLDSDKSRQRAVVFISRRATIERIRAATGGTPLLLPYNLIERTARSQGDVLVLFCVDDWVEVSVFRDGSLASCSLVRRVPGTTFKVSDVEKDLPEDIRALPVLLVASKPVIERVQEKEAAGLSRSTRFLSFGQLAATQRKMDGLFHEGRRTRFLSRSSTVIAGLSILVIVLGTLLFMKFVRQEEEKVRHLRETCAVLEEQQRRAAALQEEIEALGTQRAKLEAEEPLDAYLFLSELSRVLGSDVRVRSLLLRGNIFQLEAGGSSALKLMELFQGRPRFSAVKLSQVVPDPATGRERFAFSGVFHAR